MAIRMGSSDIEVLKEAAKVRLKSLEKRYERKKALRERKEEELKGVAKKDKKGRKALEAEVKKLRATEGRADQKVQELSEARMSL